MTSHVPQPNTPTYAYVSRVLLLTINFNVYFILINKTIILLIKRVYSEFTHIFVGRVNGVRSGIKKFRARKTGCTFDIRIINHLLL